jgi:hypothetical protein
MKRSLAVAASFFVLSFAMGCGDDACLVVPDSGGTPTGEGGIVGDALVQVTGDFYVLIGETSTLVATTVNGTDSAYTWSSSDDTVATVDETGKVTGVKAGQVTITATGADTAKAGTIGIVVAATQADVPNYDAWAKSAHADKSAEAFVHWDGDDPAEVPTSCAKCHTSSGFRDYLGDDGSAAGTVDKAAAIGQVVDCQTCHNNASLSYDTVAFPSFTMDGENKVYTTVSGLGREAVCMTCHQGRHSTDSVNEAITTAALADDDTFSDTLGFSNIHYFPAAATLNAGRVRGGYQYAGKTYDWRFRHVPKFDTCITCHDAHSLEVKVDKCKDCHTDVTKVDDLKNVRMIASKGRDYDGDGDVTEGLYGEIDTLRANLLVAIKAYAAEKSTDKICYGTGYPYFFIDTDGDGECDATEGSYGNKYAKFSPRLVRATYNYQMAKKDPGAFAHNGKYVIQLLFDSIEDLNKATTTDVDLSKALRNDPGHFNGANEAARHWDEDESVSASCSKCHSGSEGLRFYLTYGVGKAVLEQDNGLDCYTCHENFGTTYDVVSVASVTFPGDTTVADSDAINNLCGTCHSGREGKLTIDAKIAAGSLGFRNVHYKPAAAVKAGSTATVGYEYDGKTYAGVWKHTGGTSCTGCHDPVKTDHSFSVEETFTATCGSTCHAAASDVAKIRMSHMGDYDGDGDSKEDLADEIAGLGAALLSQLQTAAGAAAICYDAHAYPYFFKDTNGNGVCDDASEANYGNSYKDWTAAMMKGAHNYQISQKDPGAWAHNFDYMAQLLIDSIEDLGGTVTSYTRP